MVITNHKSIKMKKLLLSLFLIFSSFAFAQNIAFDFAFVDAENINAYDVFIFVKNISFLLSCFTRMR